ncbi:cell wall-active antibiotics response protein LiaF [Evansella halocellulosilytica]|uniref:cell wall-active antibiotics response protein LiaF n=1 Tax=Evansella halocellulosilytica TaxID=2011013 RepID=UPI000BB82C1C|nr:cell wall-active antibiotics response protein LiaF [Evansella halocellulosilytica]
MKNIIGILILTTGIVFLLSNTGVLNTEAASIITTFWPVFIILIGLKVLFEGFIYFIHSLRRDKWHIGKMIWGSIILAIGVIILGNNAGWFDYGFRELFHILWPLLIVYIGVSILFNRKTEIVVQTRNKGKKQTNFFENETSNKKGSYRKSQMNHKQFIGDIQLGKQAWELDGADISMGIGSIDIDLTTAVLKDGENVIDIDGWIGSIEILVPRDMAVKAFVDVRIGEVTLFDDTYSGTSRKATYTSPNFHDAEKQVVLHVNLNVGDVEVLTID